MTNTAPRKTDNIFDTLSSRIRFKDHKECNLEECCQFVRLPYNVYRKFANQEQKETEAMMETLCYVLPYISEITKLKKKNILASFEEVEYYSNETILE